ncbi:hypothetical protein [Corynebacterium epidermidicanis]|uniref:Secreted protein n=1 Tax=Corynebacterium epidermidicanis TaxID=1050174 RepID=A0A0G3GY20_9CORY|nr:hypothetical protein [Corynebacterium epidermidicanis]AKK03722.1 hypothetical protein CEPID_09385 [Corynebacterium epidermidicanis]
MNRTLSLIVATLSALALAGCSGGFAGDKSGEAPSSAVSSAVSGATSANSETSGTTAPNNKNAELADAYAKVLDNPGAFDFIKPNYFTPAGTYSYFITEVTGDDSPELLLRADVKDYYAPVTVFSKPNGGELFNTREVLLTGAGSAGGGRADVFAAQSGIGLYQADYQSIDTEIPLQKYVIRDRKIVPEGGKALVRISSVTSGDRKKIDWTPVSDRAPLEQLRNGSGQKAAAAPGPQTAVIKNCGKSGENAVFTATSATSCGFANAVATAVRAKGNAGQQFSIDAASPVTGQQYSLNCSVNGNETVCEGGNNAKVVVRPAGPGDDVASAYAHTYEGVVVVKSAIEVSPNGQTPNGEGPENEYIVLELSSPQDVSGPRANIPSITRSVSQIGLGAKEISEYGARDETGPWRPYVGKRIKLHINNDFYFQSDASLPMGMPRVSNKNADYSVEVVE